MVWSAIIKLLFGNTVALVILAVIVLLVLGGFTALALVIKSLFTNPLFLGAAIVVGVALIEARTGFLRRLIK